MKNTLYTRSENGLRLMFFWYVGLSFLCSGVMHLFFGNFTAGSIGWAQSPFQFEVGLANWSMALLGFMAYAKPERYFQLGALLALVIFSIGAGGGHIYQVMVNSDQATSNAGTTLYTDIISPLVMLALWFKNKKKLA